MDGKRKPSMIETIQEYVRNQLQEDIAADQISLKEFIDPFMGEPVSKGK